MYKSRRWSHTKVHVQTVGQFCKRLLQKHETVPFTRVNVAALPTMWHLTCVDSDEPLQPTVKLSNSKWCSVSSLTIIEYSIN